MREIGTIPAPRVPFFVHSVVRPANKPYFLHYKYIYCGCEWICEGWCAVGSLSGRDPSKLAKSCGHSKVNIYLDIVLLECVARRPSQWIVRRRVHIHIYSLGYYSPPSPTSSHMPLNIYTYWRYCSLIHKIGVSYTHTHMILDLRDTISMVNFLYRVLQITTKSLSRFLNRTARQLFCYSHRTSNWSQLRLPVGLQSICAHFILYRTFHIY